jgi:hypothetical protein
VNEVDICNLGLTAAKAKQIASLDDDSAEGRASKSWYAPVRDLVLGDRIWSFAKEQYILDAPLADAPKFRWEYAFEIPAEIVRVHRVSDDPDDATGQYTEWEIHGRRIFANVSTLYVTACKKVEDSSLDSPGFCVALGLRLGSLFAVPFSGSRQLRADLFEEYQIELKDAAGVDGSQGRSEYRRSTYLADRRR